MLAKYHFLGSSLIDRGSYLGATADSLGYQKGVGSPTDSHFGRTYR